MAAATLMPISPPFVSSSSLLLILNSNHQVSSNNSCKSYPSISSSPRRKFIASQLPSTGSHLSSRFSYPPCEAPLNRKRWKLSALRGNIFLLDATPVEENAQEIVSASNDGSSSVIAALILVAFVGLSVLTIGVIYIAVTDFLQKREKDKFEKEEAAKKKKSGNKGKIRTRARAGPRGFGQKIEEEIDD